jgi:hypothetical protein
VSHIPRDASNNLNRVNEWIHSCTHNHDRCREWLSGMNDPEERPTRILELMPNGVKLQCDVRSIVDFNYFTLSHMWGIEPSHQLRLSASRLEEFRVSVPQDELPAIFKEAIRITRHTGFKYIWIDSLCIIQDSPLDWELEASRMSIVYSQATCNIAFVFPPNQSFSRPRKDPRVHSPCIIRGATTDTKGIYVRSHTATFTPTKPTSRWPWSSRAWVWQS